jgi:hypothetical protein
MLVAIAIAIAAATSVGGTILDALTGAPVAGAVVTDGKGATATTDAYGRFQLTTRAETPVDLVVRHPSYVIFGKADVPAGSKVEIRLRPSSIQADALEIVDTREEDLRPYLLRQDPIALPAHYTWQLRTCELKGVYRVCVAKDGKISLVAALEPAGSADPYIKDGIAKGWQYKQLPAPACFNWRVTLRFCRPGASSLSPSARPEPQAPPPASPFRQR